MMRATINAANKCRDKIATLFAPWEEKLTALLGIDTHVIHQVSDGWCLLVGDDDVVPIENINVSKLLLLDRVDALDFIERHKV